MDAHNSSFLKPRCLSKALALACFIKGTFCIYMTLVSWHSKMERPWVQQSLTRFAPDVYPVGTSTTAQDEKTYTVTERLAYKVNSELPYSDLMALLDDQNPDGSLNEHFYGGMQFKLWKQLLPFLSWDGERMLKIAIDELVYGSEDSAAFMPLLPYLVNVGGKTLRFLHLKLASRWGIDPESVKAPKTLYMALAGVIIANLAGIVAAGVLYLLVWEVMYRRMLLATNGSNIPSSMTDEKTPTSLTPQYTEKIAYFAVLFFCLGPATVHCTSIYTENIFCMCTFGGLLLLFFAEDNRKIARHCDSYDNKALVKAYICEVAAVALFFLGATSRSNGVLLLIPLFFYTLRTCSLFSKWNLHYAYDLKRLCPKGKVVCYRFSYMAIARFLFHWLRSLVYAVTLLAPMVIFQLYLYCLYCLKLTSEQLQLIARFPAFVRVITTPSGVKELVSILKAVKLNSRPWCAAIPPQPYAFVQKQYWDVGFLWVLRQPLRLHVFLYCWTSYLVTYYAIKWYATFINKMYKNLTQSVRKEGVGIGKLFS
ncbi:uncharacterized protein BXIN_2041 [Babesia sp. Xinjiang]|uniref:uncharacterized protein n=1 Tax=Babesia sp. Xinjiang TaxID=462227 RepID=UPI000A2311BB|nr:uncharacterized protein BXIN_2041 [Babesia sp. Xinjiang]ORM40536.1 hypothetical protein BXIN_2041 [Babesia sp. Xinjiang]